MAMYAPDSGRRSRASQQHIEHIRVRLSRQHTAPGPARRGAVVMWGPLKTRARAPRGSRAATVRSAFPTTAVAPAPCARGSLEPWPPLGNALVAPAKVVRATLAATPSRLPVCTPTGAAQGSGDRCRPCRPADQRMSRRSGQETRPPLCSCGALRGFRPCPGSEVGGTKSGRVHSLVLVQLLALARPGAQGRDFGPAAVTDHPIPACAVEHRRKHAHAASRMVRVEQHVFR